MPFILTNDNQKNGYNAELFVLTFKGVFWIPMASCTPFIKT